ncbi:dihydrofolate reductase family protein [Pseudoroseicyclus sp. H15]
MTEGHVFIATSLDGYIARVDGGIDWLDRPDAAGEDHGYDAFMARMDGLVMGRLTFKTVLGFGIPWPYSKPVVVLSRSMSDDEIPPELKDKVRLWSSAPDEAMERLTEEGWARAYVDGGQLIQSFMRAGFIKELTISRLPLLLGGGRPLFGALVDDVAMTHLGTETFPSGIVQSRYRVA